MLHTTTFVYESEEGDGDEVKLVVPEMYSKPEFLVMVHAMSGEAVMFVNPQHEED